MGSAKTTKEGEHILFHICKVGGLHHLCQEVSRKVVCLAELRYCHLASFL